VYVIVDDASVQAIAEIVPVDVNEEAASLRVNPGMYTLTESPILKLVARQTVTVIPVGIPGHDELNCKEL